MSRPPPPGPRPRPGVGTRARFVTVRATRDGADLAEPKTYEVRARSVATAFHRAVAYFLKANHLRVTPETTIECKVGGAA